MRYVFVRLLILIPTLFGLILIAFLLIHSTPADPVLVMTGMQATGEERDKIAKELGLDQPLHVQFFVYLSRIIRMDWGSSLYDRRPVLPLIARRFMASLQLGVLSIILGSLIGISTGLISARRKGTYIDNLFRILSLTGYAVPGFWLGLLLMMVFSIYLKILPAMGGGLENIILPVLTLTPWTFGMVSRLTRSTLLDLAQEDFVMVARAKGLSEWAVWLRHILRNALIPIITVVGLQFGKLMAGTFITETVFNYPGLGLLLVESLSRLDYPIILGSILLGGIVFSIINLVLDLSYPYLDARIARQRI
jgi:ABC-type dipeptide/oligopeptide/nickel transport system permease component